MLTVLRPATAATSRNDTCVQPGRRESDTERTSTIPDGRYGHRTHLSIPNSTTPIWVFDWKPLLRCLSPSDIFALYLVMQLGILTQVSYIHKCIRHRKNKINRCTHLSTSCTVFPLSGRKNIAKTRVYNVVIRFTMVSFFLLFALTVFYHSL